MASDDDLTPDNVVQLMREHPASRDVGQANGRRVDQTQQAARAVQVLQLRLSGMTYGQIAEAAGYSSDSAARRAMLAALNRVRDEQVDELRAIENARLDRQLMSVWTKVLEGDMNANTVALRIAERRARLNGLDRPSEIVITPAAAEIQDLVAKILELTGSAPHADIVDADVIDDTPETFEEPLDPDTMNLPEEPAHPEVLDALAPIGDAVDPDGEPTP